MQSCVLLLATAAGAVNTLTLKQVASTEVTDAASVNAANVLFKLTTRFLPFLSRDLNQAKEITNKISRCVEYNTEKQLIVNFSHPKRYHMSAFVESKQRAYKVDSQSL